MTRLFPVCAVAAALALAPAEGHGQNKRPDGRFDTLEASATPVTGSRTIGAMFWFQLAACDELKNDFERRQCAGLREARRAELADRVFLLDADSALIAGEWSADSQTVPLEITSCVVCDAPVVIGGEPRFVVGSAGSPAVPAPGAAAVSGLRGPTLYTLNARVPADKRQAFRDDILPRLRTQLLFRLPAAPQPWTLGDTSGMAVDIAGYRVYDRCTGKIFAASPPASSLTPDKRYCKDEPVVAKAPPAPTGPVLPAQLLPADIQTALAPATEAAQACYEIYGVAGTARFRIVIDAKGAVTTLDQRGDFLETPTGTCIEKAVRAAVFPPSQKAETTVDYPFVLR